MTTESWLDGLIGVTAHPNLTGRDTAASHPADAIDTDAFTGNIAAATNVQEALDLLDAASLGGTPAGADVTLDDAAFAGNLVGVTDVQTFADTFDAFPAGAPTSSTFVVISASESLSEERVLTEGHGISITDGGANAAVTVAAIPWSPVTGFTATPASVSTITMTTDHTSWVRKGDAIKLFVSVPVVSKNNVIVS